MEPPVNAPVVRQSRERPDLLTPESPKGLRVVQITTDPAAINSHIYMESHIFTPDSRRFVYRRFREFFPNDNVRTSRDSILYLCDIDDDFSLRQLTDEAGALAPAVSPDGKYVYYIVDQTVPGGGKAMLKRVCLDSYERETLLVLDSPLPGSKYRADTFYLLSSISSDGRRLAAAPFLYDGKSEQPPRGLLVFDLVDMSARLIFEHPEFYNMHPQYCRSKDSEASRDIMIQHNHGSKSGASGRIVRQTSGIGGDIHVIRDDGTNWRDLPWGRDGEEFTHGHECWRGEGLSAIGGVYVGPDKDPVRRPIVEAWPVPTDEKTSHRGKNLPGARRNVITRNIENPGFNHFAFDPTGTRMVADHIRYAEPDVRRSDDCRIYIGTLPEGENSCLKVRYLLHPGCSWSSGFAHPHPFLSPDGKKAFFNSDIDGTLQIWMVEGYEYP